MNRKSITRFVTLSLVTFRTELSFKIVSIEDNAK